MDTLAVTEVDRLATCEGVIERGLKTFVEVGEALLEIRDSRLYRTSHTTFEAYCRERWGMSRKVADRTIRSAEVAGILRPIGRIINEAQARELAPLRDDAKGMAEVLQFARQSTGKVTARGIREAIGSRLTPIGVNVPSGREAYVHLLEVMAGFHGFLGTYSSDAISDEVDGQDRAKVAAELDALIARIAVIRDALLGSPALAVV